jgi:hypothetical protein
MARDKCLTTLSVDIVTTTYSVSISFFISFLRHPFIQLQMLPRNFPGETDANNKGPQSESPVFREISIAESSEYKFRSLPLY